MIHETANRVQKSTSSQLNQKIEQQSEERIRQYQSESTDRITQRLQELDREWDVERTLQTNFATVSILGVLLTSRLSRRWSILSFGVPAFMVQHALQGWCPPLAVLRRLGVRTAKEINDERFALKSLRGDFASASQFERAEDLIDAVRR
jgi:hypothetical protein